MEEGKEKVSKFWAIRNLEGQRQWELTTKPYLMSDKEWRAFQEELHHIFIRVKEGLDILRWGYKEEGSFSIKEAYNLKIDPQGDEEGIWRKI